MKSETWLLPNSENVSMFRSVIEKYQVPNPDRHFIVDKAIENIRFLQNILGTCLRVSQTYPDIPYIIFYEYSLLRVLTTCANRVMYCLNCREIWLDEDVVHTYKKFQNCVFNLLLYA